MAKVKTLILLVLGLAAFAFSQSQSSEFTAADSIAFSKFYVSIEGGEKYPFGDLVDAVDNAFYAGLGARYAYWEDFDGIILFQYSYFEPHSKIPHIYGVHEVSGKLGLDYRWKLVSPVILGAGFLCNWTRADYDEKHRPHFESQGGTITDNETEFGWFARLNLPVLSLENYRVGMNMLWEQVWTLPERSNMLSVGLYVERRIW
ncbi:MAG: hypothetical protein IJ909_03635 [Fibrobacter sp.]|nr:hypothetical protein [Fibrobacter sp.]